MTWALLAVAIATEIAATSLLKTAGQGHALAIAAVAAGYVVAFALVAHVVQRLEVGVVYAIWSGVGTAAVALIGVVALGESSSALKLCGVALIVAGVVAINLGGGAP